MKKVYIIIWAFLALTTLKVQSQSQTLSAEKRAEISDVFDALETNSNFVDNLVADDLRELPVGIKKTIGNIDYTLAISAAEFSETHASLTAYVRIHSIKGQDLLFGVTGLQFSLEGGFASNATLVLLGDFKIALPGNHVALTLKGSINESNGQASSESTRVTIDCNGFKELFLNADVEFSELFIPCSNDGEPISGAPLKTNFQLQVTNANDILVALNVPKFQIKGLNDFVFNVTNAVFDFSDTRNAQNINFPKDYLTKYFTITPVNLWQGVYFQDITIMLPKSFQNRTNQNRISFSAHNLLVDNNGASGTFAVNNILSINEGSASGWAFSIDELSITLVANTFAGAGFNGNIRIPVAKEQNLHYNALISTVDNTYSLTVSPKDELTFNLWQAKVRLDHNSYLRMALVDKKFRPEAHLNGEMDLNLRSTQNSDKDAVAKVDKIVFQDLHLQTVSPYLDFKYIGYQGDISIGNLPASITELSVSKPSTDILSFNIGGQITLCDGKIACAAKVGIETIFAIENSEHRWNFHHLRFDAITLKGEISGLTLEGGLEIMDNDAVYGNGIKGHIGLGIESLGVEIKVKAIFGKKEFAYWYVYGSASFPSVGSGYFNIHGFMGGVYSKMRRLDNQDDYVPDKSMGFGLRAGLMFDICSREVADCMAEFEIAFNSNMSLRYISLFGSAKILSKMSFDSGQLTSYSQSQSNKQSGQLNGKSDEEKANIIEAETRKREQNPAKVAEECAPPGSNPGSTAGIGAYLAMKYDFMNKSFHASLDVYVNFADGMISGVNANHHAGSIVIHIGPKVGNEKQREWYIHAGTPAYPLGVKIGLGNLSIRSKSYFMMGTVIAEMPMPPARVIDILGLNDIANAMKRNNEMLSNGKGVAFGADFAFSSGDLTFFPFYANVEAGMGFDVSMQKYEHLYCKGSSQPVGNHGWYAQGQLYAYLAGEIGIKVNLLFVKGKFPIISAGAAALMKAKLPKPTSVEGYVGLQYSFLGGLVKGKSRFHFSFGNSCEFELRGSPLDNIEIIADISPRDKDKTDVFNSPQLALNYEADKSFVVPDDFGNEANYKISLDKFELTCKGVPIVGKLKWNANKDKVSFESHEILPPNSTIALTAVVSFFKQIGSSWQVVYVDGKKVEERKSITFTTGEAPNEIPVTNIVYSYPVPEQRNFYKNERSQGYVQLKTGQTYLFNVEGQKQFLVWQPIDGSGDIETAVSYSSADKKVSFSIPANLKQATAYNLNVISRLPETAATKESNEKKITRIADEESDDYIEIAENKAQTITRTDIGIVLLTYPFRSSAYNTFAEKINRLHITNYTSGYIDFRLFDLRLQTSTYEPFDLAELIGTQYSGQSLVSIASDLQDDRYARYMYTRLYQYIPFPDPNNVKKITVTYRDVNLYGVPPAKAFAFRENYIAELEAENYTSSVLNTSFPYIYNLFTYYQRDYENIINQLVNVHTGTTGVPHYIQDLIVWGLTAIPAGAYGTKLQYVLPDKTTGTSANIIYHANN